MTGDEEDDVLSEIFPKDDRYAPAEPTVREFEPWHRPRKQFVRRKQWILQIGKLVGANDGQDLFRYLSLPGSDMLDVRLIGEELDGIRRIRFLGFNRDGGDQAVVSLDEIRKLRPIDEGSLIMPDDVRAVGTQGSLAYARALEHGPFDVINLDFCDNVLSHEVTGGSMYDAIRNLIGLQRHRLAPWLLFLTTRVDREHVPAAVVAALDTALDGNFDGCEGFAAEVREGLLEGGDIPAGARLATCKDKHWLAVYALALSTWLLGQTTETNAALELASCMSYCVDAQARADDLLSLAFRISPEVQPARDPVGLAAEPPDAKIDECVLAKRVVRRIRKRIPVDDALADPGLREEMIEETVRLLVSARYDEEKYRAWVETQAS